MLLGPSDCPRLQFNVLSIDYVRVTNCFYDYDYDLAASTIGMEGDPVCIFKFSLE